MLHSEFIEKQYFGLNKMSLARRISISCLCFVAYYWRENNDKSGDIYFFIGLLILVFSLILFFILHFKTQVINNSIILDGLWTSRRIKIDIASLASVKKVKYSNFILNRAVYNLHIKGKIRFYTRGEEAIEAIDKDGLIYIIGSQKAAELINIIQNKLKK